MITLQHPSSLQKSPMKKHFSGWWLFVVVIMIAMPTVGYAQNASTNYGSLLLAQDQGARISASEAGNIAKQRYGGKVLKITPVRSDGGTHYEVRLLLDSGKVINVTVDGNTGAVR
jgi:Peptidase propeptide and YPEB domain